MFYDSLKYALRFFIRLVIFFLFIYLINFLSGKNLLITDTFAAESINSSPHHLTVVDNNITVTNLDTVSNYIFSNTTFYGFTSKAYIENRTSFGFNYINNNKVGNYDIEFVIYSTMWTQLRNPYRVILKTEGGLINVCDVSSSSRAYYDSNGNILPTSNFNTVSCKNVDLTSQFNIWLFDTITTANNTTLGISNITLKKNQTTSSIDKNTESVEKVNDTLTSEDIDKANNQGSSFFNDFDGGSEGSLTDIVSLPLQYIQSLNDSCKPFTIPLGQMGGNVTIPCLSSIWSNTGFAGAINTAKLILNGFICYKLLVSLFLFFKDLKDPDSDKVEVMNL